MKKGRRGKIKLDGEFVRIEKIDNEQRRGYDAFFEGEGVVLEDFVSYQRLLEELEKTFNKVLADTNEVIDNSTSSSNLIQSAIQRKEEARQGLRDIGPELNKIPHDNIKSAAERALESGELNNEGDTWKGRKYRVRLIREREDNEALLEVKKGNSYYEVSHHNFLGGNQWFVNKVHSPLKVGQSKTLHERTEKALDEMKDINYPSLKLLDEKEAEQARNASSVSIQNIYLSDIKKKTSLPAEVGDIVVDIKTEDIYKVVRGAE